LTGAGNQIEPVPPASKAQKVEAVVSVSLATLIILGFVAVLVTNWLKRPPPLDVIPIDRYVDLKVAVRGAVKSPGVYTLQDGDRVEDAIKAAGGLTEGAIPTSFNPAVRVHDQDEIYVVGSGEATRVPAPTSTVPAVTPTTTSTSNAPAKAPQGTKYDLNAATVAQLLTVPGIAEVTAGRIVESRDRVGPYRKVEQPLDGTFL
jgi:competence protein ComEA